MITKHKQRDDNEGEKGSGQSLEKLEEGVEKRKRAKGESGI